MNLKKRVSRNPAALVAAFTLPLWNRKIARAGLRNTTEEEKFKAFAALHPIDVQVSRIQSRVGQAVMEQPQLKLLNILL